MAIGQIPQQAEEDWHCLGPGLDRFNDWYLDKTVNIDTKRHQVVRLLKEINIVEHFGEIDGAFPEIWNLRSRAKLPKYSGREFSTR